MSKLFGFIKKHVIASLAICLGAVALIVSGTLFIVSAVQYDQYGKDYEAKKETLLANMPLNRAKSGEILMEARSGVDVQITRQIWGW